MSRIPRTLWRTARTVAVVGTLLGTLLIPSAVSFANGVALNAGDVLASTGAGTFKHFTRTGTLLDTLDDTTASTFTTGGCFDASGAFYGTNFSTGNISKFDKNANLVSAAFAGGMTSPESCTFDKAGNLWVGDASSNLIREFSSSGALVKSFAVARESRGTDWLDLAADQCTMLYTSEGSTILSFNVCTSTQNPAFATGLSAPCFANRIRPNGEVLVACSPNIYRLSATGAVLHTYTGLGVGGLFSLNLDPDGTSFWTGDANNGIIYHVDIATGATLTSFSSASSSFFGLTIVGEINVGGGDTTPPACALTAVIAGPPKQIQITVQDPDGAGLRSIVVNTSTNANTVVPAFTPGTTSPVVVTATKIDQTKGATVVLTATDTEGNVTTCDPAIVTVNGSAGKPVSKVVTGVAQAESTVSIYNNTPGVKQIDVKVNGKLFKATRLANGEVRTLNVAPALKAGNNNTIVLTPRGTSGSAEVVISDMGKHTAALHGTKHVVVDQEEQESAEPD